MKYAMRRELQRQQRGIRHRLVSFGYARDKALLIAAVTKIPRRP